MFETVVDIWIHFPSLAAHHTQTVDFCSCWPADMRLADKLLDAIELNGVNIFQIYKWIILFLLLHSSHTGIHYSVHLNWKKKRLNFLQNQLKQKKCIMLFTRCAVQGTIHFMAIIFRRVVASHRSGRANLLLIPCT